MNRLSHLKQKEWQVGYLSKFINATPSIIEFLLIMFILLILFLNINIDLIKILNLLFL